MANNVNIQVTATNNTHAGFAGAQSGMQRLKTAALALSPALIPIGAQMAPIAVGAAAAGVAVAAFGAAIIPQALAMGRATEAQKKYSEALESQGRTSEQAAKAEEAWLKAVRELPPSTRQAAASLSILKDQYKAWGVETSKDTMPVLVKSFGVLGALLPKLTPVVKGVGTEFDRLLNRLGAGMQTEGFDAFMVKFTDFATRSLHSAVDGLTSLGGKLANLGGNNDFQRFMAYVRETGPLVGETLRNLGRAAANLVESLSGSGVSILTVVNAIAKLIAAVPPGALSVFVQAYAAFKLFAMGAALITAVVSSQAIARLVAFFGVMRAEGVASAVGAAADSMTRLQKATIALAVIAAVTIGISQLAEKARGAPPDVDRLTTSLKNLAEAGKFTGELRKTFTDIDGLVKRIGELQTETQKAAEATKGAFGFRIPVLDDIGEFFGKKLAEIHRGDKSLKALQEDFKSLDEAMSNLATSGHADTAAKNFHMIAEAAAAQGYTLAQVQELLPKYGEAVASLEADQRLAAQSMGLFGEQAVAVQAKLDAQKQSTDGLRQSIQALNDVNRQAMGGMIGFEAAIDAAAKGAAENAGALNMVNGVLDLNGEKARTAASLLSDLASKTDEAAAAARDNGAAWASISGIYERGRQQLLASAEAMGLTKAEARALADQILSTPDKTAYLRGDVSDLQAKLKDAQSRLARTPLEKQAAIRAEISDLLAKIRQAQTAVNSLDSRTIFINTVYRTFREQHPGGQAQAHGGIIGAAGGGPRSRMTLVGEQGPELVDLAPGSRVRSNPDSKRIAASMAGGGGGGPITIQLMLDGRQVAEAIFDPLRHEIRTRGGNVQAALGQRGR
jgi:hypothetical protein